MLYTLRSVRFVFLLPNITRSLLLTKTNRQKRSKVLRGQKLEQSSYCVFVMYVLVYVFNNHSLSCILKYCTEKATSINLKQITFYVEAKESG